MFSFLWGGGNQPQRTAHEEQEEYEEDTSLPSHPSVPLPPSPPPPQPRSNPHSRQLTPPTSHHPSPHPSPEPSPHPSPSLLPSPPTTTTTHPDPIHDQTHYYQHPQPPYTDDPPPSHPYDSPLPSDAPLPGEAGEDEDLAQFDLAMIPLLRASLKRKDEQLIALEEQHDRDIQQLRAKYKQLLSTLPGLSSAAASTGVDASQIHAHPDYLSLHEQYSRLFDEYNALQEAYGAMERGQGELMGSMREEVEYDVRQSMHAQFEDMRRGMDEEREEERRRWREEAEEWRRQLEAAQAQLHSSNGLNAPPPASSSDPTSSAGPSDSTPLLLAKDEEIAQLSAQLQSVTSAIEDERLQMADEQSRAMERADAQTEEIERLREQLSQPAEIQLYSNEEWEAVHVEVDRLRERVAELEAAAAAGGRGEGAVGGGGGVGVGGTEGVEGESARREAELQQHIAALDAHIREQEQELQRLSEATTQQPATIEAEALRQQVLHLTGELAKKDGELQSLHRTVGQKLEQVKLIIKKKDAEIARMRAAAATPQ